VPPETRYARSGGIHIAYQVAGDGPVDVVMIPGFTSHAELAWEMPFSARRLRRAAAFARLIWIDKRGTGLSDRTSAVPSLEDGMDDVRAVMDAVACERAALWGISEGGPMSILFAATYPERTTALVLEGTFARLVQGPGYPWGFPLDAAPGILARLEAQWGTGDVLASFYPSTAGDPSFHAQCARWERNSASPGALKAIVGLLTEIDVRAILPTIDVPTLVVHAARDPVIAVEHGRYLAEHIAGARYLELPLTDHDPLGAELEGFLDEVEEFLTGNRAGPSDRVLATILFTDIVESTALASRLGDTRWRALLDRHDEIMRTEIARWHGKAIQQTGDGFLASFDGPARAVGCALAAVRALAETGVTIRAGVHTGECERRGDTVGGIAVHIGARVAALAAPGEVLVSRTVKDLVAGSGLRLTERGEHVLRGLPDRWQLYAAEP
jgi:class 3 adenylate cyclase